MTQSMTGFARGSVTTPSFSVTVEIRSVNNRFLDLHMRCPEQLRGLEPAWRRHIAGVLNRGKVEVSFRIQANEGAADIVVNQEHLRTLARALGDVSGVFPEAPMPDRLALLLAPGVLTANDVDDKAMGHAAGEALNQALAELVEQRHSEGEKLAEMVRSRVANMQSQLATLKQHLPQLREQQHQRLLDRLEQAGVDADSKRLEEELVYVAQRSDVDEEMDRLGAHLEAILDALNSDQPCGRRLDFLMQELNREANTLSSKSTALSTTNTAVEFKVLIEQMREQIQNIE